MILEVHSSGPAETNTYLLICPATRKAAAIDVPFESVGWIVKHLHKHDAVLDKILLTHSHWDHTADVAKLKEKTGAPVYVHHADAGNLEDPGSDGLPLYFPIEGVKPDHYLKDGQIVSIGDLKIEVIHTPGHTPGGVCFYLETEKVLISGDTLFRGTIGNLSFPTARPSLMWESLKRLAHLPHDTVVYTGHGDPTTIGREQWIAHARGS